jgi:transposase InsO family protein
VNRSAHQHQRQEPLLIRSPRYAVWQKNQMWGSDWTKLSVGGVRWYLLTVIDFFSRLLVAFEAVPTVHAGYIKAIYQAGMKVQGISHHSETKPELRMDRGSPNTSAITREFFEALGAELSFARSDGHRQCADRAVLWDGEARRDLPGGKLSR